MQSTFQLITNWEAMREDWHQQLTTSKKNHEVLVSECSKENKYTTEAIACMRRCKEECLDDIHHFMNKLQTAEKVSINDKRFSCNSCM